MNLIMEMGVYMYVMMLYIARKESYACVIDIWGIGIPFGGGSSGFECAGPGVSSSSSLSPPMSNSSSLSSHTSAKRWDLLGAALAATAGLVWRGRSWEALSSSSSKSESEVLIGRYRRAIW